MIIDEELNQFLENHALSLMIRAIEDLGYEPDVHIVPAHFNGDHIFRAYIDFLIENYGYNYLRMTVLHKKLNKDVLIVVDTSDGQLLINQLKRYFKLKAFL